MINVKFQKLNENAILPKKATDGAAAYDLYTPDYCVVPKGRSVIKLAFAMAMPYGIQAIIEPRSGNSRKGFEAILCPYLLDNGMKDGGVSFAVHEFKEARINPTRVDADIMNGKVDADYRGEVCVMINNRSGFCLLLDKHQRIAQMTFQQVENVDFEIVDELDSTERGAGGFGHTGSK